MSPTQPGVNGQLAQTVLPQTAPSPYSAKRIGWELERTAMGDGYYGSAIRAAMDFDCISLEERQVLERYAAGNHKATDHIALQEVAHKVYSTPAAASGEGGRSSHGETPIQRLGAAIELALDECRPADVLSVLAGAFVGLTVELARRQGHDPDVQIKINGGTSRDITIHAKKKEAIDAREPQQD